MALGEQTLDEQLEELEMQLLEVIARVRADDLEAAREAALDISTKMDCLVCKSIENGVLGGIMFIAGLSDARRAHRANAVVDDIQHFMDTELAEAKRLARNLEGKEAA